MIRAFLLRLLGMSEPETTLRVFVNEGAILRQIQRTLWPNADADYAWDADTVADVADILMRNHIYPATVIEDTTMGIVFPTTGQVFMSYQPNPKEEAP